MLVPVTHSRASSGKFGHGLKIILKTVKILPESRQVGPDGAKL